MTAVQYAVFSRRKQRAVLTCWIAALAAIVIVLGWLGQRVPAPPLLDPARLVDWASTHDPAAVVMGLARLGGLAIGWCLLTTTALGVTARVCRAARLTQAVDRATVAPVRRLLHASVGTGLLLLGGAPAGAATATTTTVAEGPPVLRRIDRPTAESRMRAAPTVPSTTPPPALGPSSSTASTTMKTTTSAVAPPTTVPPPEPAPRAPVAAAPPAGAPAAPAPPSPPERVQPARPSADHPASAGRVVGRGESFWRVARSVTEARLGRPASVAEVAGYWRALIAANTDRLADRGNPDLLFAGQVLDLPP